MPAPDPSTRASLASSDVETTTGGTGAEMSPTFAGGYRHGGVGGENGGGILIKEAGICQECGYYRSAWYQTHPQPFFQQQIYIVLADPHQGRKVCSSKRRGKWRFRPASPLLCRS